MDRFDTLEIKGVDKDSTISYDPWTHTHIVGGHGITFASPSHPPQHIPLDASIPDKKIQPSKVKEQCPPESLRFVPNQKSQHLIISPSGLMVVSKQSSKTNESPIVYTNYGFSTGIHYWEIICPLSCTGIRLGVVKVENKKLTTEEMNVFRTTTARVVGILLDLDKKTLQFWLNGKEQPGRTKALTEGYWLPAIRMSGLDNCVILNPYGQHPSFVMPYACYSGAQSQEALKQDLEGYLKDWVLVTYLKTDVKAYLSAEMLEEIVPKDETGKDLETAFVRVKDVSKFSKACEDVKANAVDARAMAKMLIDNKKTPQVELLVKCIRMREEGVKKRVQEAVDQAGSVPEVVHEELSGDMTSRCEYLPYTDKLLLVGKNCLKLIPREDDEKVSFMSKPGSIGALKLDPAPQAANGTVKLHMSHLEAQQLLGKISWTGLLDSNSATAAEYVLEFVQTLTKSLASSKGDDVFLRLGYLAAKKSTDCVMRTLLHILSSFEADPATKATVLNRVTGPSSPLLLSIEAEDKLQSHLSLEDLHLLLSIVVKLDEQLWCLTSSDDVGEDVRALWDVKTSRLHTAYGRLSSYITWPTPGAVALAEAGLCNVGDKRPTLKHFMEPGAEIENSLRLDQRTRGEIWSLLEKSFPNNRMLRGEPCVNVPLSVTLRYLPAVRHTNSEQEPQDITHVEQHPNSHFVLTGSADGTVNVWNSRLRLFRVAASNFKKRLDGKAVPVSVKVEEQEVSILTNLFDEEVTSEPSEAIELPSEEKPKTEEKKPEEVKKVVQPKQELLDQIVSMGFPIDLAKKALIQVNNESLELAMDALLELQSKEPPRPPEKKVEQASFVILSWACPKCTLINVEGCKACEICNEPAPQSAYKYETKAEEKKVPMPPLPEKEPVKEVKEKPVKVVEEETKLLESATVCGYAMVIHEEYPATPFTLVCALAHEKGTLLRLRRFKYGRKYLQSFVLPSSSGQTKGYVSQITDLWIGSNEDSEVKQHLFGECRDIVETYSPLFLRNQHRDGWCLEKTKLAASHILPRDELDMPLQYEKILAITAVDLPGEKENSHHIMVLAKKTSDSPLSLIKVSVSNATGEDAKLLAKIICEIPLPTEHASLNGKLLYDNSSLVMAVTKEAVTIVDADKMTIKETLNEPNEIHNVCIVSEGEPSWTCSDLHKIAQSTEMLINTPSKSKRQALAFIGRGLINRYWLTPKVKLEKREEPTETLPQPTKMDYPEIKAADLTIEDLTSYERQMKATRVGSKALPAVGTLLASSKKDQDSGYCSKHNWIVCDQNKSTYEFILEPYKKTTLNHLSVSLTFTQEKASEAKPESKSPVEDVKEEAPQAKEAPIKGLGLLSVRGGGDASSEEKKHHIPLFIATHKGAQYSFQNHVSRMLTDSPIVFASNYPQPHFVMCHQFGKRLLVDRYVVRAEMGSICGGQPIGAGLIFIADTLSAFEHAHEFAHITNAEQYKKWMDQRKLSPKPLQPYEPAGFFEMGGATAITCDIDCKRPGYYIMLKPTSFRTIGPKPVSDFLSYPLEIQYFGVMGQVLEEELMDISNIEYTKKIADDVFVTNYKMQVLISDNGVNWIPATNTFEPITIGEIKAPCNIDVRELVLNIAQIPMPLSKYGGLYKAAVMDSRLQTIPAKMFKIVIEKAGEGREWLLSGVNAEAYIACESEINSKTLRSLPTSYLRTCMGDIEFFSKINKAIVELATKSDANPSIRLAACQFLHKIIKTYPGQAVPIAKTIALDDFIHLNIYQREKATVATAVDLLQQLSVVPEFCKQVYKIILQDISVISSFKLSPAGKLHVLHIKESK